MPVSPQRRPIPVFLVGLLVLSLAFCDRPDPGVLAPHIDPPHHLILDGAHAGTQGFYFLPPLASAPPSLGVFDKDLSPVVDICLLDGDACGALLVSFTMATDPESEPLRVDEASESYIASWHTDRFDLIPGAVYRISVRAGPGVLLGLADVEAVASGKDMKNVNTDESVALKDGRTLPIKFRIETGIVGRLDVSPAVVTIPVGSSQQFSASLFDLHDRPLTGRSVAWAISEAAVATVDEVGLVAAVASGTATVSAQSGQVTGYASLTVGSDSDGDGVVDSADNCPDTPNPDQLDADANGIGDVCEGGGGPITGTVTRRGVQPAVGIQVIPIDPSTGDFLSWNTTGEDGSYTIPDPGQPVRLLFLSELPIDDPMATVPACWGEPSWDPTCSEASIVAPGTAGVDIDLSPVTIEGTVRDRDGEPIPFAAVVVFEATSGEALYSVAADAEGRYQAVGWVTSWAYIADEVRLAFSSQRNGSGYLTHAPECWNDVPWSMGCSDGATVVAGATGIDAELVPHTIQGRVTGRDGEGVPYPTITVIDAPSGQILRGLMGGADGSYVVDGWAEVDVFAGNEVRLAFGSQANASGYRAYLPECWNDVAWSVDCQGGAPLASGATGIDVQLTPHTIEGRVTGRDGEAIPYPTVRVIEARSGSTIRALMGDADGFYVVDGWAKYDDLARYEVRLAFGAQVNAAGFQSYVFECWNDVPWSEDCHGGTSLGSGAVGIDPVLTPAILGGRVTSDAGTPIPGVEVQIIEAESGYLLTTTLTGTDGTWMVDGWAASPMFAGDPVRVGFAVPTGSPYESECWNDAPYDAGCSAGSTVAPGTSGVDAVLTPP